MAERVAEGKVVVLHYTVKGEDGQVIETTEGREPLAYLHGKGNVVAGLERALLGVEVGTSLTVTLAPADAYGEKQSAGAQPVPRSEFPRTMRLEKGMPIRVPNSAGEQVIVWVTKVVGSKVWIDVDHPLAGRSLTFDATVLFVRDPTFEELEHGHAHGISGAHGH